MSLSSARSSITGIWLIVVATTLWLVWGTASLAALVSIGVIGLIAPLVLFFFARRPEETMAEAIRDAQTRTRA